MNPILSRTASPEASTDPIVMPDLRCLITNNLAHHNRDRLSLSLADERVREETAYAIGYQAIIYGYSAVTVLQTLRSLANNAPFNTLQSVRWLRDHTQRAVVCPNVDTLYQHSALFLGRGPIQLRLPSTHRYCSFQIMDGFGKTVGVTHAGEQDRRVSIVGPGYDGELPPHAERIDVPTNIAWMLGRFGVAGERSMRRAHQLQDRCELRLIGDQRRHIPDPIFPDADPSNPRGFFTLLHTALQEHPMRSDEAALLQTFQRIGIGSDEAFAASMSDAALYRGLNHAFADAQKFLTDAPDLRTESIDGWSCTPSEVASFGDEQTDYALRAQVSRNLLAALPPEEALYFECSTDQYGEPLDGSRSYALEFPKGALPPAKAFWSVTLYGPDRFLIPNAERRYALGSDSPGVVRLDGSVQIFIGTTVGIGRETLPAPDGSFSLMLRLYQPHNTVRCGMWKPPAVRRLA
jgi:hypothetical protein